MKLSIIVPVYKGIKDLNKFIKKISEQTSLKFEIIFVVDTNNDGVLQVIDEIPLRIKSKISVVYNSKRVGRTEAIYTGAKTAKYEYSIVISSTDIFDLNMVKNILAIIKTKQTDIIEFPAKFKEPIKFNGAIRKHVNKSILINEKPSIVAYTYPFGFNKIFRTEVLVNSGRLKRLVNINSRFSIEYVYKSFLVAKTYSTSKKVIIISKSSKEGVFNPLKLMRQWTSLEKYIKENYEDAFHAEITYARMFHEMVFMFGFVGASKNKVLFNKLKKTFNNSLKEEFEGFFFTNKYMLMDNKETQLIRKHDTAEKLTKVFKNISNA